MDGLGEHYAKWNKSLISLSIMLSQIRQRKTNTVWYHLYVESKKTQQTSEYNIKETDSQI